MEELKNNYTMPRIGDIAPDFTAKTTHGPLTLSEYAKDSWTIMFSHPADFTPVCTTEMSGFAIDKDWFAQHNTKLIGLSIDSVHSHLAWVNNVREKTGVYMDFPIIADLDMNVANMLGRLGRQWRRLCTDHWGDSGEECARTIVETVEKNLLGRLGRQWRRICSDDWGDSGE